jgi:hypothetical protein
MTSSKDHMVRVDKAEPPHENCYCEKCYPLVHRWAYKMIFESYQKIAEDNGTLREQLKNSEKEEQFLLKSGEEKDKYIDHLQERIIQLEAAIISGGAIVPDAKPFEE